MWNPYVFRSISQERCFPIVSAPFSLYAPPKRPVSLLQHSRIYFFFSKTHVLTSSESPKCGRGSSPPPGSNPLSLSLCVHGPPLFPVSNGYFLAPRQSGFFLRALGPGLSVTFPSPFSLAGHWLKFACNRGPPSFFLNGHAAASFSPNSSDVSGLLATPSPIVVGIGFSWSFYSLAMQCPIGSPQVYT